MERPQPKLSVAVLTYKHEQYVAQALDGIFMQQVDFDYEVVIADDCSPDGTRAIIEQYRAKYPDKIRTVFPTHNLGMWENVLGLYNALEGEYYAFVEGDDYWTDPNKLQMQMDFMESHPDYVCCFHNAAVIRDGGTKNELSFNRYPEKPVNETTGLPDLLMDGNYVPTSGIMMRNVFKGNYPREIADRNVLCDTMNHFLHASKGKYHYINKDMSVYRLHPGGVTEGLSNLKKLESMIYMIGLSDNFTGQQYHATHQRALQKWYYWALNNSIELGDKARIKKYLKLIEQNREYDDHYHANFIRKVWLGNFVPGGKFLLRLFGK